MGCRRARISATSIPRRTPDHTSRVLALCEDIRDRPGEPPTACNRRPGSSRASVVAIRRRAVGPSQCPRRAGWQGHDARRRPGRAANDDTRGAVGTELSPLAARRRPHARHKTVSVPHICPLGRPAAATPGLAARFILRPAESHTTERTRGAYRPPLRGRSIASATLRRRI